MANKSAKIRKALYISKAQYWCIQYLKAVTNKNASEIAEAGLKYCLKHIGNDVSEPKKPQLPENRVRLDLHLTKDTIKALELFRVKQDMFDWSQNDFGRYGIKHLLGTYKQRFPEMAKILYNYGQD